MKQYAIFGQKQNGKNLSAIKLIFDKKITGLALLRYDKIKRRISAGFKTGPLPWRDQINRPVCMMALTKILVLPTDHNAELQTNHCIISKASDHCPRYILPYLSIFKKAQYTDTSKHYTRTKDYTIGVRP